MKIANFVLNMISYGVITSGMTIPIIFTFMYGIVDIMFAGTGTEMSSSMASWIGFGLLMVFGIIALILLIESIVYFGNRKKVTPIKYAMFQYINAGISIVMNVVVIIIYYALYVSLEIEPGLGWGALYTMPIIALLINVAVIILTHLDYKNCSEIGYGNTGYMNNGNDSAGYMNNGYGNTGYMNNGYGDAGYGNTGYGNGNTGYNNDGYNNNGYR